MNQAEEPIALLPVPSNVEDITGQVFGRLTVLGFMGRKSGDQRWICQCSCGTLKDFIGYSLRGGNSKSCGCARSEKTRQRCTSHGMATRCRRSFEYSVWAGMVKRCRFPHNPRFKNYAGRGIKVCEEWLSFEKFYSDMGDSPSKYHSIDRINVNGNYEPTNCRWATRVEQNNNRRNAVRVFDGDEWLSPGAMAVKHGLAYQLVYERARRGIQGPNLVKPSRQKKKKHETHNFNGLS